jgi:hypothetical protein
MTSSGPKKAVEDFKTDQVRGAQRELLEELFNDIYVHRKRIYLVNFFRGISFGIGSVLGGTILVAVVFWLLSQFVEWFPLLGELVRQITEAASRR